MLVIGFGLHNATEGFGIVAPLAGDRHHDGCPVRRSRGFLLAMGAISGGPSLAPIIGHSSTSEPVAVVFLTLAAGSIIYVITQLITPAVGGGGSTVAAKTRRGDFLGYDLLIGLLLGFGTDAIVSAAGV